mgnify:FL=1
MRRFWSFCFKHEADIKAAGELMAQLPSHLKACRLEMHQALKQATSDIERMQYNTVVSATMKMLNTLETVKWDESVEARAVLKESVSILIRVLYPIAPHITTQLWTDLGFEAHLGSILDVAWPEVDQHALVADEMTIVVQVNGKLRGQITVPTDADKATVEAAALANENVKKFTDGKTVRKIIVVPKKLVNIVVN